MRSYETVVVLDAGLEEEPTEKEVTAIEQIITANNGEIVNTERWGNRKLSYEINDKHQGYYALFRFKGEPVVLEELDRAFKLNDHVLRHIVKRVKKQSLSSHIEVDDTHTTVDAEE